MNVPKKHLTDYDSSKAALLVIDMQEFFRYIARDIVINIQLIVEDCNKFDIPVFWTRHECSNENRSLKNWWGENNLIKSNNDWMIMKEFIEQSKTNTIIDKTRYDAFHDTKLNELIKSHNVETLIISGVQSNLCCESTARRGFDLDYNIIFLNDATATFNKEMHEATLLNLGYGYALISSVYSVIEWLRN